MTIQAPANAPIDDLAARIRGRVIRPTDDEYDAARQLAAGGLDKRPLAIARVADATDVSSVLGFVVEQDLPVSVRCGGHSISGASVVDDGVVIDVHDLRSIELDLDGGTAWIGAGYTAAEVSEALSEHGLAIGFGDTGSVGVAGITLGGGVGYLARKFGLSIDSLLAAELVTADGEMRMVDKNDPDLFWAIRGAGANFGVATRFRFRLAEVPAFQANLVLREALAVVLCCRSTSWSLYRSSTSEHGYALH